MCAREDKGNSPHSSWGVRKNNTHTYRVELEQIHNRPTLQELNEFSAGRFMRGLHWLQKEVSPTPTPGHSKVDREPFLSLCARTNLPVHTNLSSASSARISSHVQAQITPKRTVQIKTKTQDRHSGEVSIRSLWLPPDPQAAVVTVWHFQNHSEGGSDWGGQRG